MAHINIFLTSTFAVALAYLAKASASRDNMNEDQIKVDDFDVKPGGMVQEYEQNWDGFVCKFTYACQGGTNENWIAGMSRTKDQKEYTCSFERKGGMSYLFFQEFKVEVQGYNLKSVDIESENGNKLGLKEYDLAFKDNLVKHVDGEFQSKLAKIEVYASKGKEEL